MKASTVLPNTTPIIPTGTIAEGMIVGMENPHSQTLEAIYCGHITEDGRMLYHWQTGTHQTDDGEIVLADTHFYELTPALKTAARRYRHRVMMRNYNRPGPVPPTPKGVDHTAWLVRNNCD